MTNFSFTVGETIFPVHRVILSCRSPEILRKTLHSCSKEFKNECFEVLKRFLRSGSTGWLKRLVGLKIMPVFSYDYQCSCQLVRRVIAELGFD
ncbi:CLUMA_CG010510, isoform A [Clunio marinus]|uniref:CLUMA_CG010510, isoform A n=1 Tax=Clunio marinus TaxID=568069 RepID=A0A1J1I9Z2_9DIPT|nr:CLUMA_CG010510, isoform A [Clunio marinus]